jgi:Region found in RelA / SpoT proteins
MKLNIEIQVGTVVMHAWSEVEHDIAYKPFGGLAKSEDVRRMADLINGIATAGEVALRQLQAATRQIQERRNGEHQRPQAPAKKVAENHNRLGAWLHQDFAVNNLPTKGLPAPSEWKGLKELFEVLRACG